MSHNIHMTPRPHQHFPVCHRSEEFAAPKGAALKDQAMLRWSKQTVFRGTSSSPTTHTTCTDSNGARARPRSRCTWLQLAAAGCRKSLHFFFPFCFSLFLCSLLREGRIFPTVLISSSSCKRTAVFTWLTSIFTDRFILCIIKCLFGL